MVRYKYSIIICKESNNLNSLNLGRDRPQDEISTFIVVLSLPWFASCLQDAILQPLLTG